MREIQLFKPIFNKEEILTQISECLDKGWTGLGFKTVEFEEKFKQYTGVQNAHFLNSATSALHLALELAKARFNPYKYYNVLTTPLTFISDTHVIYHAELGPLFVDIDKYLCMSPDKLDKHLSRANNALAVIYVGIGGNTGDLAKIVSLCNYYNIPLIFDASHCMGTHYNGRHVGTEADYTVFSFQAVKNLPTADSGMLVCKDSEDDKLARKLSWLGISKDTWNRQTGGGNWDYNVEHVGWKYHGNSIMAAMGIAGLEILEAGNRIRREIAGRYILNLDINKFRFIPTAPDCLPSKHLFQVRVPIDKRDSLISYAASKGVQLGVHYKCHTNYKIFSSERGYCLDAERISKELVSLPIGPHLSEDDVSYVIEVLNSWE